MVREERTRYELVSIQSFMHFCEDAEDAVRCKGMYEAVFIYKIEVMKHLAVLYLHTCLECFSAKSRNMIRSPVLNYSFFSNLLSFLFLF